MGDPWPALERIDGVDVRCSSRWWGNQVNVTAESPFPIPEKLILYVSAKGMDHGFWRDLPVGDRAFDRRFFVFCDAPALLPIVCGDATRRALTAGDIVLYVRNLRVTTTGIAPWQDTGARERHVAIHRALADDHRSFLARWKARMDVVGRADAAWPPTATVLRPSGALRVQLTWTSPATRDSDWDDAAASLRTEVTAHDDRARVQWRLREVSAMTPCTHVLARRRFVLVGKLPLALAQLEHLVEHAQLTSIAVEANRITVGVRGLASARQLEGALRVIHLVVDATASSPYR